MARTANFRTSRTTGTSARPSKRVPTMKTTKRELTSPAQGISAFGGIRETSVLWRTEPKWVRAWKRWGFLPPSLHWRMEQELRKRGYEVSPKVFGAL